MGTTKGRGLGDCGVYIPVNQGVSRSVVYFINNQVQPLDQELPIFISQVIHQDTFLILSSVSSYSMESFIVLYDGLFVEPVCHKGLINFQEFTNKFPKSGYY